MQPCLQKVLELFHYADKPHPARIMAVLAEAFYTSVRDRRMYVCLTAHGVVDGVVVALRCVLPFRL